MSLGMSRSRWDLLVAEEALVLDDVLLPLLVVVVVVVEEWTGLALTRLLEEEVIER